MNVELFGLYGVFFLSVATTTTMAMNTYMTFFIDISRFNLFSTNVFKMRVRMCVWIVILSWRIIIVQNSYFLIYFNSGPSRYHHHHHPGEAEGRQAGRQPGRKIETVERDTTEPEKRRQRRGER